VPHVPVSHVGLFLARRSRVRPLPGSLQTTRSLFHRSFESLFSTLLTVSNYRATLGRAIAVTARPHPACLP
jgi:hypothetical protein